MEKIYYPIDHEWKNKKQVFNIWWNRYVKRKKYALSDSKRKPGNPEYDKIQRKIEELEGEYKNAPDGNKMSCEAFGFDLK